MNARWFALLVSAALLLGMTSMTGSAIAGGDEGSKGSNCPTPSTSQTPKSTPEIGAASVGSALLLLSGGLLLLGGRRRRVQEDGQLPSAA